MQTQSNGLELLVRAIVITFDRRKVFWACVGLFVSGVIVGMILYIGATLRTENATVGDLLRWLGLILWVALLSVWMGVLAKMCGDQLRGETGNFRKALSHAFRHLPALLLPLMFGMLALIVGGIEWGLFFLGREPTIGTLVVSCLFAPLMVVNMAMITLFAMMWWLMPGIVAIDPGNLSNTSAALRKILRHKLPTLFVFFAVVVLLVASVMALTSGLLRTAQFATAGIASAGVGPTAAAARSGVLALASGFDPGVGISGATTRVNLLETFIVPIDQVGALFSISPQLAAQSLLGAWLLVLSLLAVRIVVAGVLVTLLASTASGMYLYLKEPR